MAMIRMLRRWRGIAVLLLSAPLAANGADEAARLERLRTAIAAIDADTPGRLGVYVKHLPSGRALSVDGDRPWYLGSALKLPLALAVLREVERGRIALDDAVRMRAEDRIDGSGPLVWHQPGATRSIAQLLEGMLMVSDNTAANMLVRTIGLDTFTTIAHGPLALRGDGRLTDFTQVRRDVYAELHPSASRLSNLQLVQLAAAPLGPARVTAFRRMLGLQPEQLQAKTIEDAYARFYAGRPNAVTLVSYGGMLEQMVLGRTVSPPHLKRLYDLLKFRTYDAYRLEAGLPRSVRFIHKTGTQYRRACHAGVIDPQRGAEGAIVVVACAEELDEHRDAEDAFARVGRAITATFSLGEPGGP